MGLFLLNISVDNSDPNPDYIPEDLSFNDQESIVEILLEKVLGFEDAIQEYDDRDIEDPLKKKNVKIDLLVYSNPEENLEENPLNHDIKRFPNYHPRLTIGLLDIDCPPPQV